MRRPRRGAFAAIALVLAAGVLIYSQRQARSEAAIVGVVRATEVKVEPEVDGQLASIAVERVPTCTPAMSWRSSPRSS